MIRTGAILLVILGILAGCGGGKNGSISSTGATGTGSGTGSTGTPQLGMNGTWAFAGQNTLPASQPGFAGGTFTTSGTAISGQIYGLSPALEGEVAAEATLKGTITATGTVTVSGAEIGSSGKDTGQTVTLAGTLTGQSFVGTITLSGGTTPAVSWAVSGYPEPTIAGNWTGTAISAGQPYPLQATLALSSSSANAADPSYAVFAVQGSVTVQNSPCITTAQIYTLSSQAIGPFLMIDAGVLSIEAIVSADGSSITGMYTITGGPCYLGALLSPSGTFTLTPAL